jgi:hypothetical protein
VALTVRISLGFRHPGLRFGLVALDDAVQVGVQIAALGVAFGPNMAANSSSTNSPL